MNRLEHHRIKSGLTQVELAEKSGVERTAIVRAEKGVRELKGTEWASIASVLDCTIDELLGTADANP